MFSAEKVCKNFDSQNKMINSVILTESESILLILIQSGVYLPSVMLSNYMFPD